MASDTSAVAYNLKLTFIWSALGLQALRLNSEEHKSHLINSNLLSPTHNGNHIRPAVWIHKIQDAKQVFQLLRLQTMDGRPLHDNRLVVTSEAISISANFGWSTKPHWYQATIIDIDLQHFIEFI